MLSQSMSLTGMPARTGQPCLTQDTKIDRA